jgi:hypothetical protein
MLAIGEEVRLREGMPCHRCRGLMVVDYAVDLEQSLSIVRCLNCGEVIDARILENRKRMTLRDARPHQSGLMLDGDLIPRAIPVADDT